MDSPEPTASTESILPIGYTAPPKFNSIAHTCSFCKTGLIMLTVHSPSSSCPNCGVLHTYRPNTGRPPSRKWKAKIFGTLQVMQQEPHHD